MIRALFSAVVVLTLASCAPPRQTTVVTASAPPGDVYTCVMRELARMEYRVTDTDRESGFVRAEKEDANAWIAGSYWTELTVTVLPGETDGTELQVNVQRSRGDERSTAGMTLTDGAREDAARVQNACGG